MGRRWPRVAPRLVAEGTPAWRGAAAYGAMLMVVAGGVAPRTHYLPVPRPAVTAGQAATAAALHRIVLPDLVVIDPKGLDAARLAGLAKITGVRETLAVDGASISAGGRKLNAIGVDPQQFRSWTPLHTASRQRLWSALAAGGFVASPPVRRALGLHVGTSYQLTGAAAITLAFGGSAPLGIRGIGLVVSNRVSASLGLIHNVAVMISAPGVPMASLRRQVRAAVGAGSTLVSVRQQQLPAGGGATGRPASWLALFRASAARYCPGLSWTVLAAIGQIESGDGTNNGPSTAGALGPMQFLPATWRVWGILAFGEPGPPNIMDPYDAVPSAARLLCAAGASTPAGLPGAIFAYNHAHWYVAEVLALAHQYARAYG